MYYISQQASVTSHAITSCCSYWLADLKVEPRFYVSSHLT